MSPLTPSSAATRGRVLIVDDEPSAARVAALQLATRGYETVEAHTAADALSRVTAGGVDAIVLDLNMPDVQGLDLLAQLLQLDRSLTVVMLSGSIEVAQTVQALRAGAEDVLTKPVDAEVLSAAIDRGLARTQLMRSKRLADIEVRDPFGLLDDSPAMRRVRRTIDALQRSVSPVLIVGERGTGKSAVAELLHQGSPLSARPFVTVSCASREPTELERALLGAVSLDDTGAPSGVLAHAGGGTLFLADLDVLAPSTQALLLALVDPRVRARHAWVPANIRVVASTTRDLAEEVRAGRLRADLHQQLAVVPLALPSLRDRGPEAVATLARRIVTRQRVELAEGPFALTEGAMQLLVATEFPGNARQLRLVLEDAFARAGDADAIDTPHLREALDRQGLGGPPPAGAHEDLSLEGAERAHIAMVLRRARGNRSEAARLLGITRSTLYKKIADYGLGGSREG